MCVLPWKRVVLFDVETDLPLVLYDLEGGLRAREQEAARSHFAFLHTNWRFSLDRFWVGLPVPRYPGGLAHGNVGHPLAPSQC